MRTFTLTEVEELAREYNFGFSEKREVGEDVMHYTISVDGSDFNKILEALVYKKENTQIN